ncbi:MAG TPA: hypothetical protein PK855_09505 [Bacteroidales bacterium]|nr:hypothetical protein [Bacteroidales bacterium]
MKTIYSLFLVLILTVGSAMAQSLFKPYILGFETTGPVAEIKSKIEAGLLQQGLKLLGQYQPGDDMSRWIFVIGSSELEAAVQKTGGLSAFASAMKIGITSEGGKTLVSYTNPFYWANAYFQKDYSKVTAHITAFNKQIEGVMKASGTFAGTPFGSENGISGQDLQRYHYMMGMPYFEDTVELGSFESFTAAVAKIDASAKKGTPGVKLVYKVSVPGKELCLYGFALGGPNGEAKFLPIIDKGNPKHTAFLPYEVLVVGKEVHMLHGRYRIALSFPDLTMGTFSKIMSTPGDIEDMLEQLVK